MRKRSVFRSSMINFSTIHQDDDDTHDTKNRCCEDKNSDEDGTFFVDPITGGESIGIINKENQMINNDNRTVSPSSSLLVATTFSTNSFTKEIDVETGSNAIFEDESQGTSNTNNRKEYSSEEEGSDENYYHGNCDIDPDLIDEVEDDSDERQEKPLSQVQVLQKRIMTILTGNFISDDSMVCISHYQIFESKQAVRIIKFVFLTFTLIISMHFFARTMNWEHDPDFTLSQFTQYDLNNVLMDTISFAILGRCHQRRGVDRLFPFIIPTAVSCSVASWLTTDIWFLQNSITWYNIRYTWPWQLHLFTYISLSIIVIVIGLHIKASVQDQSFLHRFVEGILIIAFFIAPHISESKTIHLHHWYSFWLCGVFCNRKEWWSQFMMALSWGVYINGVSVYGRDGLYDSE